MDANTYDTLIFFLGVAAGIFATIVSLFGALRLPPGEKDVE